MNEPPPQQGQVGRRRMRAYRREQVTSFAPDVMISELETHHARLQRVGNVSFWKILFLAAWQVFLGAFIGAAIAEMGAVVLLPFAVAAVLSFIAWMAVRDVEAESVKAICEDYKANILDSIEFEEIVEEETQP